MQWSSALNYMDRFCREIRFFFTPFTKTTPGRLWRQRGINEAKLIFVHYKRKPLEEPHFEMDIEHAANPL